MIKLKVKTLNLGDVDDPEVYLGAVAWDWLKTEHGQWCKQHSTELVYQKSLDFITYGFCYNIMATFPDEYAVLYKLKWGEI